MLGNRIPRVLLILLMPLVCVSYPSTLASAQENGTTNEQKSSSSIPDDYVTPYSHQYSEWRGGITNDAIAIQTGTHLAKHGSTMDVFGDINSYVLDELDRVTNDLNISTDWRSNFTIDVFDEDGDVVGQYPAQFWGGVEDEGDFGNGFVVDPALYSEGQEYTVKPGFHLADSVMDAVNPEVRFYLTTLPESEFIVENPSTFQVLAEDRTFDIEIASSSIISDFAFSQSEKKLSFTVEADNASRNGVAQLTIPSELLGGEIMIVRDGQEIPRNEAILVIQEDTFYLAEVNYSHDTPHMIEILGTEVIPEFPIILVSLLSSLLIGMVVLVTRRLKTLNTRSGSVL